MPIEWDFILTKPMSPGKHLRLIAHRKKELKAALPVFSRKVDIGSSKRHQKSQHDVLLPLLKASKLFYMQNENVSGKESDGNLDQKIYIKDQETCAHVKNRAQHSKSKVHFVTRRSTSTVCLVFETVIHYIINPLISIFFVC